MNEFTNDKIQLHKAKHVIDHMCRIFDPSVLNLIKLNNVVRISFTIDSDSDKWTHDSPFVKVLHIKNDELYGEILDINKQITDKYPLNVGEKIWFKKENIIEIGNLNQVTFDNILTNERVLASGPLFTVLSEDSDSEPDSESCESSSNSGSESNTEEGSYDTVSDSD